MVRMQYQTFRTQALASILVYVPAHVICFVLVNFNETWKYDPNVIMNNLEFNVRVGGLVFLGIMSW